MQVLEGSSPAEAGCPSCCFGGGGWTLGAGSSSRGCASCRGFSGLAQPLESVVIASSVEYCPKAIVRWLKSMCRVVTRAV